MENKNEAAAKTAAVTEAQVEAWKKKYSKVFCYEVDGKKVYFRQPDRKTLSAASMVAKNDPLKYNEIVLKNSVLGGAVELLEDDSVFYGLSQEIDKLIAAKVGELKNL